MSGDSFINILVAEDNDVSRDMISGILKTRGFSVHGAIDADTAIEVVESTAIDVALVDINMAPRGGFDFARYALTNGLKLPIVFITAEDTADLLVEASSLGVNHIIQKPITPERLITTVERLLKRQGINVDHMGVGVHDQKFSAEDLMQQAITMAGENAQSGKGRAFAAILANADGEIVGEGCNQYSSRVDPIAHAEVMAIRQAAEKMGRSDFSGYVLYCSSMPTRIGTALIESVGIEKVYYGLSHEDIGAGSHQPTQTSYEQKLADKAKAMYEDAKR